MDVGKTLKDKRKELQLTQEQLAEKIFVSTKTISNWENNKTTPDIDSLIRLANLFDLSLDNLLLEGSNIVENIKYDMEYRALKVIRLVPFFITICICIVLVITKLTLLAAVFMILIAICNSVLTFYIEYRIKKLKSKT